MTATNKSIPQELLDALVVLLDGANNVLLAEGHYFSAADIDLASAAIERARKHGVGLVWSDFPGSEASHG